MRQAIWLNEVCIITDVHIYFVYLFIRVDGRWFSDISLKIKKIYRNTRKNVKINKHEHRTFIYLFFEIKKVNPLTFCLKILNCVLYVWWYARLYQFIHRIQFIVQCISFDRNRFVYFTYIFRETQIIVLERFNTKNKKY